MVNVVLGRGVELLRRHRKGAGEVGVGVVGADDELELLELEREELNELLELELDELLDEELEELLELELDLEEEDDED